MNKYEENISEILTLENTEEIVDIFIEHALHTDRTIGLIANRYLIEYALDEVIKVDYTSVRKVNFDDNYGYDGIEYMISIDDDGNIVVQPTEYYKDKYFMDMDIVYISMDGDVTQETIDACLNQDKEVVLFGYDEDGCCECCHECDCDLHKCDTKPVEKEDEKPAVDKTTAKYIINNKEVDKDTFEKERTELMKRFDTFDEEFTDMLQSSLLLQCAYRDRWNDILRLLW